MGAVVGAAYASPGFGRRLGFAALALGAMVGIAAFVGVILVSRHWAKRDALARFAGRQAPSIYSDLLSSVELATTAAPEDLAADTGEIATTKAAAAAEDTDPGRRHAGRFTSRALLDGLYESTATRVEELALHDLSPASRLGTAAQGLVLTIAAWGLMTAVGADLLDRGFANLTAARAETPFDGAELSQVPLVGDLHLIVEYPAHTGREPNILPSSSGDVSAMPGSKIRIETTATKSATTASVLIDGQLPGQESEQVIPMKVTDGRALEGEFVVGRALTYRFAIETQDGKRFVENTPHRVEIDADAAPTIDLYAPADELDVTSMRRIELAYVGEDDYGLTKLELVWNRDGETDRKSIALDADSPRSAQGKFVWDLAELALPPGSKVSYHLELTDNDTVTGPHTTASKAYALRVFSPRERHEQVMAKQRELAENMLTTLGERLIIADEDVGAHDEAYRRLTGLAVEIGSLLAALRDDKFADEGLKKALSAMRNRIDKLGSADRKLLDRLVPKVNASTINKSDTQRLAAGDKAVVSELEDDVLVLADWLNRMQLESMLAITDEIKEHQDRLKTLMEEYARTGDESLRSEIEREMRALERRLAEMSQQQQSLSEDVLDRYVNADALDHQESKDCMGEVRALLDAGKAAEAQAKMAECMDSLDEAAADLENSLRQLRGDSFPEKEKKFGELMNDLADIARDQMDVAEEADRIYEKYAERAAEMMQESTKETRKKLAGTIEKLRKRLDAIPENGLTPFSKEELGTVNRRLDDLEKMLEDGDIAEAMEMAKQAKNGLETTEAELEAALEDEQGAPWSRHTQEALEDIDKAMPLAKKLVDELEAQSPSPDEIMSKESRKRLADLRKRQQANRERARRLGERTKEQAGDLPGGAAESMQERLGEGNKHMERADERMGAKDPSGARQEARSAADALEKAKDEAQKAARRAMQNGSGQNDEPIRIPGADQYKVPEKFREDILEAMKKERAPEGFGDLVKRYYEELIK